MYTSNHAFNEAVTLIRMGKPEIAFDIENFILKILHIDHTIFAEA
ncbi:MAG: hypothetical protein ACXQTI_07615 [Candidatus Nezhaarchaeales archaeon]